MKYYYINSRQLPKDSEGTFPRLSLSPAPEDRFLHSISDQEIDFSVPLMKSLPAYTDYRVTQAFFG